MLYLFSTYALLMLYLCSTYALLLLYWLFYTSALLMLYLCSTSALLLLYLCSTNDALLRMLSLSYTYSTLMCYLCSYGPALVCGLALVFFFCCWVARPLCLRGPCSSSRPSRTTSRSHVVIDTTILQHISKLSRFWTRELLSPRAATQATNNIQITSAKHILLLLFQGLGYRGTYLPSPHLPFPKRHCAIA